ncbi:sensor domain-containing diguanylate cyclase [Chiayiivirga flava]|uniref:diguanylate cyclase n=1 Tax=Chiayiivirga flava TaxID=659595 RepID=A0A7W8D5K6_9GAMM|nr:diguanylate cyclase [Chiayiivirga flava]MBB5208349.1 diguanylate cyclase (GGDEF)-like protein [Chiayiivirga flava]
MPPGSSRLSNLLTQPLRLPRRSVWTSLVAATVLLLAVGATVVSGARRFVQDTRWVGHTHATIEQISRLYARIRDVESAQRGYLLTGHIDYLSQLEVGAPEVEALGRGLIDQVRDNAAQHARAREIATLAVERVAISRQTAALYQEQGLASAQREVASNRGKRVMDHVVELMRAMEAEERRLLAQRETASDASAWRLQWAAALGIGLSLALIGIVFWLMLRENRVRRLAERRAASSSAQLAESVEALRLAGARLHELQRGASMLQSCRTTDEAMDIARQTFTRLFPDLGGGIYLTRASQNLVELRIDWGDAPTDCAQVMSPNDCWAVRRGQPHTVDDSRNGSLCAHLAAGADAAPFAATCVPLVARGETLGLVHLAGSRDTIAAHAELVLAAAEQLSLALSNLQLQETLRVQSIRDPLTGLYNRRYLEESLERELARCARRHQPLAVMMLDLDHFKRFNDTHGHDGGDALLGHVGRLLDALCRGEDIACRYGGEEFILILPEADIEVARTRAEQIRSAISELQILHLRRSLGPVTCSIGVAASPMHADAASALVQAADAALYRAKNAGRNRVEIA